MSFKLQNCFSGTGRQWGGVSKEPFNQTYLWASILGEYELLLTQKVNELNQNSIFSIKGVKVSAVA